MIEAHDGLLVVVCDHCERRIVNLGDGMAFYNGNEARSPVRFAHKGCCDDALGGHTAHPWSIELLEFPALLADDLGSHSAPA